MESKEFGLVAAQQLFNMESLHYGLWDATTKPTIGGMLEAQESYIRFLCQHIDELISNKANVRVLDAGCGTGVITQRLLEQGFQADGLVPSNWMARMASEKIAPFVEQTKATIYESTFEDLIHTPNQREYQCVFFSESYQYINLQASFDVLSKVLAKDGSVIIFDFFKKDGVSGKSPLGGGHSIGKFYQAVEDNGFSIKKDDDLTENMSPNLQVINDMLKDRVLPFMDTLDKYASNNHKYITNVFKFLFRKKLDKLKFKYSEERSRESFEKFKTYRFIILEKNNSDQSKHCR